MPLAGFIKKTYLAVRHSRRILSSGLALGLVVASNSIVAATSIANFDFEDNDVTKGFGEWYYADKGTNPCNVGGGDNFSKLCGPDGHYINFYYNSRNNSHIGFYRYGFFDSSDEMAVAGRSLKVVYTGGAYPASNSEGYAYDGLPVHSLGDYQAYLAEGIDPHASRILPGDLQLYFKTKNATTPFPSLQNKNRLSVWVLMPQSAVRLEDYSSQTSSNRPDQNFAWYPYIDNSRGGHYYHHAYNIPMGSWTHVLFDAHPTHHNGGSPEPYAAFREGGYDAPGDGVDYFSRITTHTLRTLISQDLGSPTVFYIDEVEAYYAEHENEETIISLAVGYSPASHLFDISFEDKYRCGKCNSEYEVRYSFEPIDNQNFDSAFLPAQVINYDRTDNNTDGRVVKANAGYNGLWAALELQEAHKGLLTEGRNIYFAVKDKSDRSAITQDTYDLEMVDVPGVGQVQRMDLVKTIDYRIIPVVYPLEIKSRELSEGEVGKSYYQKLQADGGLAPFSFSTSDQLPIGMSLSEAGILSGSPQAHGEFSLNIQVTDSAGDSTDKALDLTILAGCENCQRYTLVDFGSDDSSNVFGFQDWANVFMDAYTGYGTYGTTTAVGPNGSYDYQGVGGSEAVFVAGDEIVTTWYNASSKAISFTPRISFDDPDRPVSGVSGDWYHLEEVVILPESFATSALTLSQAEAGSYSFVNINVNYDQKSLLELDRVELIAGQISPPSPTPTPEPAPSNDCSMTDNTQCHIYSVVDFGVSSDSDQLGLAAWDGVLRDKYTNYGIYGTTITVGSNGQYDYQGVAGELAHVAVGDVIRLDWYNASSAPITFSPRVSFTDPDRPGSGVDGQWYTLNALTIQPGTFGSTELVIGQQLSGDYGLLNVNVNHDNNGALELDAIFWVTTQTLETVNDAPQPTPEPPTPIPDPQPLDPCEQGVCETLLLVDFGAAPELNEMELEGWDTVFTDKYTGYQDQGTTIVLGSNAGYDYQGISGVPTTFEAGQAIAVTWYNNSNTTMTFTPALSFTDPDRRVSGTAGSWYDMPLVSIEPESYATEVFVINAESAGIYQLVNLNNNFANNRELITDKIELVSPVVLDPENKGNLLCSQQAPCSNKLLVDLGSSEAENIYGFDGWNTVSHDQYTGYVDTGTTIVIGSNGTYDYQKVSGQTRFFEKGETISVTWQNLGNETLVFSPKVSLTDPDRPVHGAGGVWYSMTEVSIAPQAKATAYFVIDADVVGQYNFVNVNVNHNNQKVLIADKIELYSHD